MTYQNWRKIGLVYAPTGANYWDKTHAAVPIAEHITEDIFRFYYSSRDHKNRSYTGSVTVDLKYPDIPVQCSSVPVLVPGKAGEFDDSGAMATWLCHWKGKRYLYYIGWNLGVTVPFRNSIGLATAENDGVFERYSAGPIVDRTISEPHFTASCCVIPGEDKWRMWYLSCTGWFEVPGGIEHRYHIKYAESQDGINWSRKGQVAIDFENEAEFAISRPSVVKDRDVWRMWYSVRGPCYRIGYAESTDGIKWIRKDEQVGLSVSESGWDSQMIEYPMVFDHKGSRYMLYNGNAYGKTGFGLAVLS